MQMAQRHIAVNGHVAPDYNLYGGYIVSGRAQAASINITWGSSWLSARLGPGRPL